MRYNILISAILVSVKWVVGEEDEKALEMTDSLIIDNGFPLEIHEFETEDGYFLKAHRIPSNRGHINNSTNRYPVLICHGVGGRSENFVWMGPKKSLAFFLADNDYDVWLLSARGTSHSKKHKNINPDEDAAYWQFSWHEIGIYDTTAAIDYILETTHQKSIHYIGHSQGTTTLFVMASERQAYVDKIKVMIALGPGSGFLKPKHPLLKLIIPVYGFFQLLAKFLNVNSMPPFISVSTFHRIFHGICGQRFSPVLLCKYLIFIVGGIEHEQFDTVSLSASCYSKSSLESLLENYEKM
ncbi:hypothetical protein JTB14_029648 [Gonioctena quinquepunctata]|nr:hypothetical protein JTB14_029648 [Gonioctena quinquepunctata]